MEKISLDFEKGNGLIPVDTSIGHDRSERGGRNEFKT